MIVHFSCGAASAVSALFALSYHENVELVYTDPGLEHPDNHRFMRDFERLTGHVVTKLKHSKYKSPFDVFEERFARVLGISADDLFDASESDGGNPRENEKFDRILTLLSEIKSSL